MNDTRDCLSQYMQEHRLLAADRQMDRLFTNRQGEKFTRAGVTYIINKYVKMVRLQNTRISEKVSPHVFRHSKAMHLLQAGVNIIYIKDILGHVDVTTTQLYLKADMEMKKEALEKVKIEILPRPEVPPWASDRDLIEWLTELGKKAGI